MIDVTVNNQLKNIISYTYKLFCQIKISILLNKNFDFTWKIYYLKLGILYIEIMKLLVNNH